MRVFAGDSVRGRGLAMARGEVVRVVAAGARVCIVSMAECGSKKFLLFFCAHGFRGRSKDDAETAREASVFNASWRSSNMKKNHRYPDECIQKLE